MKIANSKLKIEKYYTCGSGLGGGIGDIIALTTENGIPNTEYFSYNHRGDVILQTDETGNKVEEYEYDAFGLPITDQPITDNRFIGFSSKEFDKKSGLSYYGFRFYDCESVSWISKDKDFRNFILIRNLYSYVDQSPLYWIEWYGLCKKECLGSITWADGTTEVFYEHTSKDGTAHDSAKDCECHDLNTARSAAEARGKVNGRIVPKVAGVDTDTPGLPITKSPKTSTLVSALSTIFKGGIFGIKGYQIVQDNKTVLETTIRMIELGCTGNE